MARLWNFERVVGCYARDPTIYQRMVILRENPAINIAAAAEAQNDQDFPGS